MATSVLAVTLIAATGLLSAAGGQYVLRRLPEPLPINDTAETGPSKTLSADADRAELAAKPSYRSLATWRFSVLVAMLSTLATSIAVITQPSAYWPIWFVFGIVAVFLAGIDAVSTWLPSLIVYPGWIGMAAALTVTLLASAADGTPWPTLLVRIVGCAAVAGGFYLLLWLVTRGRGIAFGDVRLMPLVGAAAGAISWSGLYWSLLLGSLVGAAIGVIRLFAGRRDAFPYAPALVSGPYAAALLFNLM